MPSAMTTLSDVARRVGGHLQGQDIVFSRVVSDTRQLKHDDLFVALKGDRFDGHDYVHQAFSLGAAGVLVAREIGGAPRQVVCNDPSGSALPALQRFAASWRGDFKLPVIGVAGSNGKTTTRELIASVLSDTGPVLASKGNQNNHIGVPLTLLRMNGDHRSAVIEMGANHPGEIAALASLARPTVGLITASGEDHLEGFGSAEASARANGELLQALPFTGTAVINADDDYAPLWRQLAGNTPVIGFGFGPQAELRAEAVRLEANNSKFDLCSRGECIRVSLRLPGQHNIANALAAAAVGGLLGVPLAGIADGLARIQPVPGRVQWHSGPLGSHVLDDSYNANPTSVKVALDLLVRRPSPRWAVLGDMAELGADAARLHRRCGAYARSVGVDRLFGLGPLSTHTVTGFGAGGSSFWELSDLLRALRGQLQAGTSILVKGSRSAHMERVVEALLDVADEEMR